MPIPMMILYFTFMACFYMLPMGFSGWFLSDEIDGLIFTTIDPQELWPLSYLTTNIKYAGIMHTFFGFKMCYILCIWFNSNLVKFVMDFVAEVRRK